ncbi:MAG: hypothetical protein WBL55_23800, partial [Xanthobacteraceae bacterium]
IELRGLVEIVDADGKVAQAGHEEPPKFNDNACWRLSYARGMKELPLFCERGGGSAQVLV